MIVNQFEKLFLIMIITSYSFAGSHVDPMTPTNNLPLSVKLFLVMNLIVLRSIQINGILVSIRIIYKTLVLIVFIDGRMYQFGRVT